MKKIKIVLDADVIIHFIEAGYLSILPNIIKNYEYVLLETVYNELNTSRKNQLNNQINILKNITILKFNPTGEMLKEYALLLTTLGKGESACMVYCRSNNDVIGSSNLKDIVEYCTRYGLTYITTLDFLYHAIKNKVMTTKQAQQFITDVQNKGSKLPSVDMTIFISKISL